MKDLKGTRTEENLKKAYQGESGAFTKYLYYASRAKKDGYVELSSIFEETANNEKEHAKIWFKHKKRTSIFVRSPCDNLYNLYKIFLFAFYNHKNCGFSKTHIIISIHMVMVCLDVLV